MRSAYVITPLLCINGCGLKKRIECTATATYEGKVRTAKGDDFTDEAKAKAVAATYICRNYCVTEDPVVDAATMKAKAAHSDYNYASELSMRETLINEVEARPAYDACTTKCRSAGTESAATFSCGTSGFL